MKKILFILTLVLLSGFAVVRAQEQDNDKIRDKMTEYIQKRLRLTQNEAERFSPVFVRYFSEWRQTLKENREDVLVRQQRIAELRIRYRNEFREIVGEKRSNEVFRKQEEFIQGLQKMREEQIRSKRDDRPNKRFRSLIQ
jgi:hypothetical protein